LYLRLEKYILSIYFHKHIYMLYSKQVRNSTSIAVSRKWETRRKLCLSRLHLGFFLKTKIIHLLNEFINTSTLIISLNFLAPLLHFEIVYLWTSHGKIFGIQRPYVVTAVMFFWISLHMILLASISSFSFHHTQNRYFSIYLVFREVFSISP